MSKAGSFALALILLLAAMVAAAWGVTRLEPNRWGDGAEIAFVQTADICYWTPGREFDAPTAVELAEARGSALRARGDADDLCYVTSTPFGLPSAHDIDDARAAMTRAMSDLCPWAPAKGFGPQPGGALGEHAVRRVVPPAVSAIPSSIAAAGAPIAIAAAALVAAALLTLRLVRRRTGAAVVAVAATRALPWLTPKRIGIVGAGWLMTVGVLAAAYPTLSQFLPHAPGIDAVDAPTPHLGRAASAATQRAGAPIAAVAALPEQVASATAAPKDFTVPNGAADPAASANGGRTGATSGEALSAQPRYGNNFAGLPETAGTAVPTAAATAQAAVSAASIADTAASTTPTTSIAALMRYLAPATSATVVTDSTPAATPAAASAPIHSTPAASTPAASAPVPAPSAPVATPASASAATPATPAPGAPAASPASPAPAAQPVQTAAVAAAPAAPLPPSVQVAATADDEGRAAIATTAIVDAAQPLPSSPDAVLPVAVAPVQVATTTPGNPPATPAPSQAGGTITRPVVALDGDDPAAVPEPAMLGLFGLGVGALAARRRRAAN